tara:strand:- start:222 stop:884 length:663 start_codon:yes stop_codon:yes gene_type:complete
MVKKEKTKEDFDKISCGSGQKKDPVKDPVQPTKLNLKANNLFCSIIHTTFFEAKQCDTIIDSLVEELWMSGEVVGGGLDKKLRNVEQQIMPINKDGWPLTRVLQLVKQANNARFKFDISGFLDVDAPMIMKYEKGNHYDWHIDAGNSVPHRKLSFTIQLSDPKDYVGGDIEFIGTTVNKEALRQKGTCVIFPSFLPHRINKVTKGTRYVIVGWVHGPTYI